MILTVNPKTKTIPCLSCGKPLEDYGDAEIFVIPGRFGAASRSEHECGWCDHAFTAERESDGSITFRSKF